MFDTLEHTEIESLFKFYFSFQSIFLSVSFQSLIHKYEVGKAFPEKLILGRNIITIISSQY